jgi:hypothetical protein
VLQTQHFQEEKLQKQNLDKSTTEKTMGSLLARLGLRQWIQLKREGHDLRTGFLEEMK